jgi:hypothetical protein
MSMGDGRTGIMIFLAFLIYVSSLGPYIAAGTSKIVTSLAFFDTFCWG